MIFGTLDRTRREKVTTDNGAVTVHRNYIITSPEGGSPSPQAYLVEQEPGEVLRTHFHLNSQFQIFVSGNGTIGRHAARPYVVQFAQRQTGYGPITPGGDGLEYLTLRPTTIRERAKFLPEGKDLLDRDVPKRQAISEPFDIPEPGGRSGVQALFESTDDGLGAWFMHVPQGEQVAAPSLANGAGRFYVIVSGTMVTPQGPLASLSVVWTGPDEVPLNCEASSDDLNVIVVQFPNNAW